MKEKNKPSEYYYGFDLEVAKRIKSAWEWEAEDELIAIAVRAKDIASTIVNPYDCLSYQALVTPSSYVAINSASFLGASQSIPFTPERKMKDEG